MLDPKYVYENIDYLRKVCKDKFVECDLDSFVRLYETIKTSQKELDNLNASKKQAAANRDNELGKQLKDQWAMLEEKIRTLEEEFKPVAESVPNLYSPDTPYGADDSENVVLKKWGEPKMFDFKPKEHRELGDTLNLLDFETAGQVSGSRFVYIKNDLVLLQFAIIQRVMNTLTNQETIDQIIKNNNLQVSNKPFTPILTPYFMKMEVMNKMGRLNPKEERYCYEGDGMVLNGSAEHVLGPMHMDSMLDVSQLPIRYLGYSTAFRREAGSYGKDTRGLIRQHQFDKLEMETFTTPEQGMEEHLFLVAIQEYLMQQLHIPHQVLICCTGDMGAVDYRHVDVECRMPGQNKYRETHSADFMADYQARRLGTRFKDPKDAGRKWFVSMNDATAIAIGRILVAIMENYQQEDGSIIIPEVLRPYMGNRQKIG